MSRTVRKKFNVAELAEQKHDEARNRLLFDWWCDEGELLGEADHRRLGDRWRYIASLNGKPTPFPSRSALQNDLHPC